MINSHSAPLTFQTPHIESLLKALAFIETHLDEPLLLQKLAKIANLSPFYFQRLFHAYLAMPPGKYIRYTRFTQSAKRLQYSCMPITEIAFAMGYEDSSSFTRAFIQLTGKSPRAYRKEMRERLHQTIITHKLSAQPIYLYQEEKTVFFRRKIGDYKETVLEAIREFQQEMTINKSPFTCFGLAVDDPLTVSRTRCRFDICASTSFPLKEHWGQRKLLGGKYAVFTHCGQVHELEERFTSLFSLWHISQREKLRFSGAYCEYVDLDLGTPISLNTRVTANFYIPLQE